MYKAISCVFGNMKSTENRVNIDVFGTCDYVEIQALNTDAVFRPEAFETRHVCGVRLRCVEMVMAVLLLLLLLHPDS